MIALIIKKIVLIIKMIALIIKKIALIIKKIVLTTYLSPIIIILIIKTISEGDIANLL